MMNEPETVEIPLSQGMVAVIDAADLELVAGRRWYAHRGRSTFYARSRIPGSRKLNTRYLAMHRLILQVAADIKVDHINGYGLDNRRTNLRGATDAQNGANRRTSKNNTSGFKGVSWDKHQARWIARVFCSYKGVYAGSSVSPIEAARAYDKKARELFGDFAKCNFPTEG